MLAPTLRLLTQVTRNLAQTAMTREVKNPYLFAALTPFVETFIEGIMTNWGQAPQKRELPTQTTPELCPSSTSGTSNEEVIQKMLQQYEQYKYPAQTH